MLAAIVASLALAAVMTFGDFVWAAFHVRHTVMKAVVHGAAMCLCMGLAIGLRAGRPAFAAIVGPLIGVTAAGVFYVLASSLRWGPSPHEVKASARRSTAVLTRTPTRRVGRAALRN